MLGSSAVGPLASVSGAAGSVSVLVCRGCCCGTDKYPEVDHAGQVASLRAALPSGERSRLFEVDCFGTCERSNVVAVRAGSTRTWFGRVLDPGDTGALAAWIAAGAASEPPAMMLAHVFEPARGPEFTVNLLDLASDQAADLVETLLRTGAGVWTMGIEGAVAEFTCEGNGTQVRRDGLRIEARTAHGGVHLTIGPHTRLLALTDRLGPDRVISLHLVVPRPAETGGGRVRVTGPDVDALRPADRDHRLIDLGVDHPSIAFCVRTADRDLVEQMRELELERAGWRQVLDHFGERLVAASPHRVVTSPIGRVEAYTPTPAPLLGAGLELGREHPVGMGIPTEFLSGAAYYPGGAWILADLLRMAGARESRFTDRTI